MERLELKITVAFFLSERLLMLLTELRKMLCMLGIIGEGSLAFRAANPVCFYHSKFGMQMVPVIVVV